MNPSIPGRRLGREVRRLVRIGGGRGGVFRLAWRQVYKNKTSRKTDSPKTYLLTENQFSGNSYFYTLASGLLRGVVLLLGVGVVRHERGHGRHRATS